MLKSHELIGFMSPVLATDILTFTLETDKPMYRTVLSGVAEARRVRPIFLERKSKTERHSLMLATLSKPSMDAVSANLLRTWLLKKYKDMLVDFLDALGITHKDGVVEELPAEMADDKLRSAVDVLLGKYPQEVVAVYLNAFNDMNEVEWPNLKAMLTTDSRLQLGG